MVLVIRSVSVSGYTLCLSLWLHSLSLALVIRSVSGPGYFSVAGLGYTLSLALVIRSVSRLGYTLCLSPWLNSLSFGYTL